jgi:hypothetical protein
MEHIILSLIVMEASRTKGKINYDSGHVGAYAMTLNLMPTMF